MTVGEALAEARYRAGLSVDEVSERTKIRETVIRCIEQDDYHACGGDLYVRGYVRAIAGAIGIDAQPLIREYDLGHAVAPAALDGTRGADTVPTITSPQPVLAPGTAPVPVLPEVTAITTIDPATATVDPATATVDPATATVDPATATGRPATARTRRRRMAILIVLAVAVAGVASGLVVSSLGHTQGKNTTASAAAVQAAHHATATATAVGNEAKPKVKAKTEPVKASPKARQTAAAVRIRSLPIALAVAFGPDGVTDGDNPRIALFAVRPGSPLPWSSQWYATANFGLLKHGTGLLVDMGRQVTVTSAAIELGPYRGADLQLRVGNAATASDLRVAARAFDAGGTVRLRLRSPERVRYLLIWFTLLPPNGAGQYQVSVYRVVVNGHTGS